jgi:hypothetical protein
MVNCMDESWSCGGCRLGGTDPLIASIGENVNKKLSLFLFLMIRI